MFKLVVLTAFFAAAAAKPGALLTAPIVYSSVFTPAATTYSHQASSVLHPSPLSPITYSAPLAYTHFIKKRSPGALLTPTTYISAHAPLTTYAAPLTYSSPAYIHSSPFYPASHIPYTAAHLIKKRSAVFPTTYIAPTTYAAGAPLLTSTYAAPFIHSAPLVHSAPVISTPIVTPHFIKKRSAPLLTTYLAPTSYSHQSRVDYTHSSPLISTTYTAPITYSSPIAYSHVL